MLSLRTMKTFNSVHLETSTWCQQKLNATGSGQLVEQWKHCSERHGDYVVK